jgi:hypothetical protein
MPASFIEVPLFINQGYNALNLNHYRLGTYAVIAVLVDEPTPYMVRCRSSLGLKVKKLHEISGLKKWFGQLN